MMWTAYTIAATWMAVLTWKVYIMWMFEPRAIIFACLLYIFCVPTLGSRASRKQLTKKDQEGTLS